MILSVPEQARIPKAAVSHHSANAPSPGPPAARPLAQHVIEVLREYILPSYVRLRENIAFVGAQ